MSPELEQQKLELECTKLQAEIANLRKPLRPIIWGWVPGLAVAAVTVLSLHLSGVFNAQRALLEAQTLDLARRKTDLGREVDALKRELADASNVAQLARSEKDSMREIQTLAPAARFFFDERVPPRDGVALGLHLDPGSFMGVDGFVEMPLKPARVEALITAATRLRDLTSLEISSIAVEAPVLRALAKLPNLRRLSLTANSISDERLAALPPLANLEILGLRSQTIGRPTLPDLPRLRVLDLSHSCNDATLTSLRRTLRTVRVLVLDESGVTDDSAHTILDMPSLESLSLEETDVTGKGLRVIARNPTLRSVSIPHYEDYQKDILEIARLRPDIRFRRLGSIIVPKEPKK